MWKIKFDILVWPIIRIIIIIINSNISNSWREVKNSSKKQKCSEQGGKTSSFLTWSYWKLSSKQVHIFPDAFDWFCCSTSKRQPSSSVGPCWASRGLSWLLLQTPSNAHLSATPAISATAISIHGNAIDSFYDLPSTWKMGGKKT